MKRAAIIVIFLYPSVLISQDIGIFPGESGNFLISGEERNQTVGSTEVQPASNLMGNFNDKNLIYNITSYFGILPTQSSNFTQNSTIEDWSNYQSDIGSVSTPSNVTITPSSSPIEIAHLFDQSPTNQSNIPDIFGNVSMNTSEIFNTSFQNFLHQAIPITVDIFFLSEVVQGLSSVLNYIRSSEKELSSRHQAKINPIDIVNAPNGIQALTKLLVTLESYYILDEILDRNLNCGENLMRLMTQLGGNVCSGVTGRVKTMYELFTTGNTQCADGLNQTNSLSPEWNESIEGLNNVTANLGPDFEGLRNFVQRMGKRNETAEFTTGN